MLDVARVSDSHVTKTRLKCQVTEPAPPRSFVAIRTEQAALLVEAQDILQERPRPFTIFFEIADLLLCSGMSVEVCYAVLSQAKFHWRHETCNYFSGIFAS